MKTYNVRLTPISSFQSFPSSDTLFGAVCWGIRRLCGEEKLLKILQGFDSGNPGFVLSSSFPLLQNEHGPSITFYPKPINAGLSPKDIEEIANMIKEDNFVKAIVDVVTKYKKFKKAEYLSEALFKDTLNGMTEKQLFYAYISGNIKSIGSMLLLNTKHTAVFTDLDSKVLSSATVQKNSIDRLAMSTGEEGQTFYQQEIYTSTIFNLHFFIMTDNIAFLIPVFKYLEDKGIGGNRSTGKGRFKIEIIGEKIFPDINKTRTFISFSRFIPSNKEINWDSNNNCYEIFPYRSKVESEGEFKGENVWKDKVMYVKEGSVLDAMMQKPFYGQCPVVKEIDGQKIRQNGITFPIFGNFGGLT